MWILREIEANGGEVGFRRFMELALYHPEHGYYTSGGEPWGRSGDYLTAPTSSGWYGATCGRLLAGLATGAGVPIRLFDVAAGSGVFLAEVLSFLGAGARDVLAGIVAVERSPVRRPQIEARLSGAPVPVRVAGEVAGGVGPSVVHASELYDAIPVHRVEQRPDGLAELTVAVAGNRLEWRRRPAGPDLVGYLRDHRVELVDGQVAEINLEAEPAHRRLLETIGQGVALVLDYGYPARRLYDPRGRRRGSLATYRRHELGVDPLQDPGERDLTAHINFDDLRRAAADCGWHEIGFMPLAEFLVRAGLGEILDERGLGIAAELDADTVAARQEIKQLLDPEGMGSDLKMLVQGKGMVGEIAGDLLSREV